MAASLAASMSTWSCVSSVSPPSDQMATAVESSAVVSLNAPQSSLSSSAVPASSVSRPSSHGHDGSALACRTMALAAPSSASLQAAAGWQYLFRRGRRAVQRPGRRPVVGVVVRCLS